MERKECGGWEGKGKSSVSFSLRKGKDEFPWENLLFRGHWKIATYTGFIFPKIIRDGCT